MLTPFLFLKVSGRSLYACGNKKAIWENAHFLAGKPGEILVFTGKNAKTLNIIHFLRRIWERTPVWEVMYGSVKWRFLGTFPGQPYREHAGMAFCTIGRFTLVQDRRGKLDLLFYPVPGSGDGPGQR